MDVVKATHVAKSLVLSVRPCGIWPSMRHILYIFISLDIDFRILSSFFLALPRVVRVDDLDARRVFILPLRPDCSRVTSLWRVRLFAEANQQMGSACVYRSGLTGSSCPRLAGYWFTRFSPLRFKWSFWWSKWGGQTTWMHCRASPPRSTQRISWETSGTSQSLCNSPDCCCCCYRPIMGRFSLYSDLRKIRSHIPP